MAYLDAMGIQVWTLRQSQPNALLVEETDRGELADNQPPRSILGCVGAGADRSADCEGHGRNYQDASPRSRMTPPGVQPLPEPTAPPSPEPSLPVVSWSWDELESRVANCTACPLHLSRTQTVFGVGNRNSDWMVIGEAPGEQEDLQGEPFVGRAGLLLNEMLRAIGLEREQVFIANILKCRPPQNRDPEPAEAAACEGYLKQQLALVKPSIILAVGRIAAQNLLKTTTPIGKLRGRVHDYQGAPLVVTYHPAYLLRAPLEKRRAFEDLRLARQTYRQTIR